MTQQPQWQPTNPPVPAVRQSWFGRHKVLGVVMGVVLTFTLICCGAGVLSMGGEDTPGSASSTSSTSATPPPTSTSDSSISSSASPSTSSTSATTSATRSSSATTSASSAPAMTTEQENAVSAAENYLSFMPFSKKGLIKQLSSDYGDGYTQAAAEYAVNHIEVDWKEQAAKAAKNYLDTMSFSRSGLIEQLTSDYGDGYTTEEATYAADQAGL